MIEARSRLVAVVLMVGWAGAVAGISLLVGLSQRIVEDAQGRTVSCGRTLAGGGPLPCGGFDGWRWLSLAGLAEAGCLLLAACLLVSTGCRRQGLQTSLPRDASSPP